MGAWIEMSESIITATFIIVAPCMGAWIEIDLEKGENWEVIVAPCMGAWIEIITQIKTVKLKPSHPAWVRGLKYL